MRFLCLSVWYMYLMPDHIQVICGSKWIQVKNNLYRLFPQYFIIHFIQLYTESELLKHICRQITCTWSGPYYLTSFLTLCLQFSPFTHIWKMKWRDLTIYWKDFLCSFLKHIIAFGGFGRIASSSGDFIPWLISSIHWNKII